MAQSSPIPIGKYFDTKAGYRIHYHEAGTLNSTKPSVLLLHGSGPGASGYSNFKGNFPFLAEQGYHCIIPDCLGYGLSSKPVDFIYSADNQVELLRELLTHIGASKVSVGCESPSRTTPRHQGSRFSITAAMARQAAGSSSGSSFHQSGRTPRS